MVSDPWASRSPRGASRHPPGFSCRHSSRSKAHGPDAKELAGLVVEAAKAPRKDLEGALDIVIARHGWPHFASKTLLRAVVKELSGMREQIGRKGELASPPSCGIWLYWSGLEQAEWNPGTLVVIELPPSTSH